jgi:superoxide dismutase, Fe-Mn family
MNRRQFVQQSAFASAGLFIAGNALAHSAASPYPYALPPLPYAPDALAPHFDAETMRIHHSRHHQTYVDKLNAALKDAPELQAEPLDSLFGSLGAHGPGIAPSTEAALRNHGGGHWNHSFFWPLLAAPGTAPSAALFKTLTEAFGSVDAFKEQFGKAALGVFGSGWVWLIRTREGKLAITTTANQDNPLMNVATQRGQPILALDVWEHAYYLAYQNRRVDYLKGFWNVVNWPVVESSLAGC